MYVSFLRISGASKAVGPFEPLEPLGFAELKKGFPLGSRIVELSKRHPVRLPRGV
jgi:hypothetical protein